MWEIIKFEIKKLLQKKIVWASGVGMILMAILMITNWIAPGTSSYVSVNDTVIQADGMEIIEINKKWAAKYEGPLTTELVKTILEEGKNGKENLLQYDDETQKMYCYNDMYSSFARDFYNQDNYNGATVEDVYGPLASELKVGYAGGWESTIYGIMYTILSWGCVIVIIVAPLFADEYTRGTDALILTASYGRSKVGKAKIIAAFLVSMGFTLLLLAVQLAVAFLVYYPDGADASIQLGTMRIFSSVPYNITCVQMLLFGSLLWITGCAVIAGCSILISALARNSFGSLVIAFAVYVVPMFIPWYKIPVLKIPAEFFPIQQMQMLGLANAARIPVGGGELNIMWLTIPVAAVVIIITSLVAGRSFGKHQVTGN